MTYSKLPGVYFSESAVATTMYEQEYTPLFLIQVSATLPGDDVATEYATYDAFATEVGSNVSAQTKRWIRDILNEGAIDSFYVYSIKTDTALGFTDAIKSTSHLTDVTTVTYIESSASTSANSITAKIGAIKDGLADNAENGVFREGYIIPYGTVNAAVEDDDSVTPEAAAVTALTTITTGAGDGRICVVVPDTMAGSIVGRCIGSAYNEEVGSLPLELINLSNVYNFNATQMLTLQNQGILFVRPEKIRGVLQYRINVGVTTSFKESSADGYLLARTIVDEMLRQIGFEGTAFVKARESESTLEAFKSVIAGIIDDFVKEESVTRTETKLTVSDNGNNTFIVSGTIKPAKSIMAIEVNTTIVA